MERVLSQILSPYCHCYEALGIECITLLGREGGSAVSSATCNALLRCIRGERY